MIDVASVQALVGRWWFNYDEGNFAELEELLTDDAHFTCSTDTGTTAFEEFVRADVAGRDDVVAWQTEHRTASPYPLRHNGTNVHIVGRDGDTATFASYIFVTHIVDGGVTNLSTAIVRGAARQDGDVVRLAELHVVLDTRTSVVFGQR